MTKRYARGEVVSWAAGNRRHYGSVHNISRSRTEIESNIGKVTKNGSEHNPALTIKQADGSKALKLASELLQTWR